MRNVKEILRLRLGLGFSTRQVAKSCKISVSTLNAYEQKFQEAGLVWPLPEAMDDAAPTIQVRCDYQYRVDLVIDFSSYQRSGNGFCVDMNPRFHVSCISSCFELENRLVLSSKLNIWIEAAHFASLQN